MGRVGEGKGGGVGGGVERGRVHREGSLKGGGGGGGGGGNEAEGSKRK